MSLSAKKGKAALGDDYSISSASISDDSDTEKTKLTALKKKGSKIKSASNNAGKKILDEDGENDSFDVVLPPLVGSANGGECTLMIEVNPSDSALLDYEGMSGAIGRFEANSQGVVVDLKGNRYQGRIVPGPTALVVGLSKGGQLRVEGITDEFATLTKTQDVMASLDAVVHGEFDEGFRVQDENVNKTKGAEAKEKLEAQKIEAASNAKHNKKRPSNGMAKTATKKR